MTEIPGKAYFTASEVARLLLVSANTVRVWANKGLLKTELTLGGHRRFPRDEIVRLVRERVGESLGETPVVPTTAEPMRILIIDDDVALAQTLAQGLEVAIDHSMVAVANDGFSGGMLARSANPHVILLDLRMPGMDGFQICKLLKSEQATQHIRIIAMSGYLNSADTQRILAAGAEQVLAKPLRIPALVKAIQGPSSSNPGAAAVKKQMGKK